MAVTSQAVKILEFPDKTGAHVAYLCLKIFVVMALTAVSAQIRLPLPFTPVPMTMQTFAVLLGAAWLGGASGGIAQVLYLVFGSVCLPLFAGAALAPYLLGPTGGYLVGFVAAGFFVGLSVSKFSIKNFWPLVGIFTIATAMIFTMGAIHLSLWMGGSISTTLAMGVTPFLLGAALKIFLAASATTYLKR